MTILVQIWSFFQNNIMTKPAFFVGLMVLVGYLLLRRPIYVAFAGFVKATVGYMILNVGSSGLINNFRPILSGLNERFELSAVVIDPYFGQSAANAAIEAIGRSLSSTMLVLVVAFLFNILLVALRKITKIRSVMTTGHIMVQQSTTALWMVFLFFPGISDVRAFVILGFLLGTYWAVSSNLVVELTQNLTDGGDFTVGHQQMFGIWLFDKLAGKIGSKEEAEKELRFPDALSIFNDNVVATGTLMMVFFGVIMLILGEDMMRTLDTSFAASQNFLFYIVEKSFNFAVYLSILQLGVRMFVAELTESFQGISERLLPGSIPAIDCAGTYGFANPNLITLGFVFGALGQFLAIAGLIVFHSPILVITGFVPVFFDNATFAIFANKRGGFKAAAICTFISGILQVLGGAVCAGLFKLSQYGGWHGNFDMSTSWLIGGLAMKYMGYVGIAICIIAMLIIPQVQYAKDKENYFLVTEDYAAYKEKKAAAI